ncbi:chemotaxis protein CheW [Vogesella sp. LIG4]|uniref:chemotaxis protein CheW n=1 Tax=Vogesella sp. LIG4 TaxID=1192162 RepID=UPI00081FAE55|nr:chemotaxis protein CheW [Vogesella sp. LIG4]SCK05578.1 two-component system, chemotaxis family, sensor kinase CheA [Vogesella sp. LIG4]
MSFDMSQFHQVFFDETAEHLANMESLLLAIDIASPDSEDLNAIFRAAHSIKGGAATFGFSDLADLTHVLENLLDKVRKLELPLSRQIVDAALQSGDLLKDMLAHHRGADAVPSARVDALKQVLVQLAVSQQAAPAVAAIEVAAAVSARLHIELHPPLALPEADIWQRLGNLGELEIINQSAAEIGLPAIALLTTRVGRDEVAEMLAFVLEPASFRVLADVTIEDDGFGLFGVADDAALAADVLHEEDGFGLFAPLPATVAVADPHIAYEEDGFGLFQPLPAVAANPVPPAPVATVEAPPAPQAGTRVEARASGTAQSGENSIRVSTEKVDLLLNLVGELVITQSMLVQYGGGLDTVAHEKLLNSISLLQRNSRELQEAVMSIRMMPISFVFQRFPRVVRDLAAKLDKQVELKMVGESTELDKGFIEKLSDPLTHLVRNSLDHGIESPQERLAKGKQAGGLLTLRAFHEGGSIVIEVTDDGAGLHRDKILAKARERGLAVQDGMSDAEVWALIFEPGFSTASEVTDVSGRGVGMDVVRKNIVAMGGRIDISSMADIGTTMTIRLPLTLAIMDGMSVMVGEETYVLPLNYILESLQPRPEDVKLIVGRGRIVSIRGEYLPIVNIADAFNIVPQYQAPEQAILIVVEAGGQKYALQVDELLGQQQFVVKNIEANYRKVEGLSGATILGDGRVALILDVGAIVRIDMHKPAPSEALAVLP